MSAPSKPLVVTGAAGFIGFHLALRALRENRAVIGIDWVDDYYDPALKEARLHVLSEFPGFEFKRFDIADQAQLLESFASEKPEVVVHLAAQAGVRYSTENPAAYTHSNLVGFASVLEACRHAGVSRLLYASSSSVYGANVKTPFAVEDNVDHPISLYAATKKSNELMAHAYSHLFGLQTIGLRFFTVYGPWGRPDMALFKFTKALLQGEPIDVYNFGDCSRDFTYVDDVIEGVMRLLSAPSRTQSGAAPYEVFNIGRGQPVGLMDMISELESALELMAEKRLLPLQPGDVPITWADTRALQDAVGYRPETTLATGIRSFVAWYRSYYGI